MVVERHDPPKAIDGDLLAREIAGLNLTGTTLGQEIAEGTQLLVFLRHFG